MKVQHSPWSYPLILPALGLSALVFFGVRGAGQAGEPPPVKPLANAAKASICQDYGRLPLYFIENRGQVDKQVKYYSRGNGHTTFFTREGVVLALAQGQKADGREAGRPGLGTDPAARQEAPRPVQSAVVRLQPVGMKKKVKIKALQPQEHRVNYFIGKDPKKWRTGIPTYQAVVYEEAYQGIDLKFYGYGRQLEYDVVVKPGADPGQVRFAYQGVKELRVTAAGDLALTLPDGGELLQKKPYVYQEIAGVRVPREGRFQVARDQARLTCGFQVAAYDKSRPLIIDPVVLGYSTYLGGNDIDEAKGIAVWGANAYVTGYTASADFPLQNAFQGIKKGTTDVFVTKLTDEGNALVYSTYLGGTGNDTGRGIAVLDGNAYITGETDSVDFPTQNAFQPALKGGIDAFVTKLTYGGALDYSTYLGGGAPGSTTPNAGDQGYGIAVESGEAYITGRTQADDFPTQWAFQNARAGSYDAFVTKLTAAGNALSYSSYLGGWGDDIGRGIAVLQGGQAYVAGYTASSDFPIQNAYQDIMKGSYDAFVAGVGQDPDTHWSYLVYSTYLGGSAYDEATGIAVDPGGNAYVAGYTESSDFPKVNAFQNTLKGGGDVIVAKLTAEGNALSYSTYLGGSSKNEGANGIAVDSGGKAYVTGYTQSEDFPTKDPIQKSKKGSQDAFVTKLSAAGNALVYSTYLGGTNGESGTGIAREGEKAYIAGWTSSSDFPIYNAFQNYNKGLNDAFVAKLFFRDPTTPMGALGLLLSEE